MQPVLTQNPALKHESASNINDALLESASMQPLFQKQNNKTALSVLRQNPALKQVLSTECLYPPLKRDWD